MKTSVKIARRAPRRQKGSYLLEALIAMLIFAFGVLGLIGLMGNSLRATNDARYRSEAANLASAMIADMWTMTASKMDTEFGTNAPGTKLHSWNTRAAALLPNATTEVDLTSQPGLSNESRTVIVTVKWQMPGGTEQHKHLMSAQIGKNPS